jgi:DNA polymerase theta
MNWGMMAAVLDHMRDRLEAGARADLLEMAQVTFVKSWTARLLRENGFRNLRALAEAEAKDLVPVLMMVSSTALVSYSGDRWFGLVLILVSGLG